MQDTVPLQIGPLRKEQIESLTDLLHEMSVHYNGPNASTRDVVKAHLVDNMLGPECDVRFIVASEGAEVVGMAAISLLYPAPKETGQLFMKELYVVSRRRSAGVGEALMRWIARYAVERNCSRFDWTAEASNTPGLRFYRELGATQVVEKVYFRLDGQGLARMASGSDERRDPSR